MKSALAACAALSLIAAVFGQTKPAAAVRALQPQQAIPAKDIGTRVHIVGSLGKNLGEMMTIEGECVTAPEPSRKADMGWDFVRVSKIDDASRPNSVLIRSRGFWNKTQVKLEVGKRYRFRGYEHGEFCGVPHAAYSESVKAGGPHFATVMGYPFETHFVVVTVQEL